MYTWCMHIHMCTSKNVSAYVYKAKTLLENKHQKFDKKWHVIVLNVLMSESTEKTLTVLLLEVTELAHWLKKLNLE